MTATAIFNDHLDLLNIGSFTHVAIDAHINDGSIHFTEGSIDHGSIGGLAGDDHLQYLLLAGRAGGQVAFGGTAATERLTLRGSTNADLGVIDAASPMSFTGDWIVASPQLAQLDHPVSARFERVSKPGRIAQAAKRRHRPAGKRFDRLL